MAKRRAQKDERKRARARTQRNGTLVVYQCEACSMTDLVDIADSTIDAGRKLPRSSPCKPCGVPKVPVAARRCTSEEFGAVATALAVRDEATVKKYLGDGNGPGVLPGVLVGSLPFLDGDLVEVNKDG